VRFVGRQPELAHLRRALEQAKGGRGQLVGVMGDPGVGKSRPFHEFKVLAHSGCLILEAFSVSHDKAYPYLPLIDLLYGYFQITSHDDERRRREKILGKVLALDRSLEDTVPYLFTLLGLAESEVPLQRMDPQIRKRRTFDAIKRLLLRESLNQPLILIFEDLHMAGLGTGRPRPDRERNSTNPSWVDRPSGRRGGAGTTRFSCATGGNVCESGTGRGRVDCAG
jgi:predicted ATPase